jgi:hypothetical protein
MTSFCRIGALFCFLQHAGCATRRHGLRCLTLTTAQPGRTEIPVRTYCGCDFCGMQSFCHYKVAISTHLSMLVSSQSVPFTRLVPGFLAAQS